MASHDASASHRNDLPESVDHLDSIERLNRWLDSPPDKYFDELIKTASFATGALAGQVWGLNETGRLLKVSSTDPVIFQHLDQPDVINEHRNLISRALFEGQLTSNPYRQRNGQTEEHRTLLLAPFHLEQESIGVVELILSEEMDDGRLPVVNELLAHISGYLSKRSRNRPIPKSTQAPTNHEAQTSESGSGLSGASENDKPTDAERPSLEQAKARPEQTETSRRLSAEDVEQFVWLLHQHTDLKYAASTSVNETRRLLICDRVCLAVRRGQSTEIIAISGQDSVVKKSNTVRAMREISDQAVTSGQNICFGVDEEASSQTDASLIAYLSETGALRLKVIPLLVPEKIDFESDRDASEQSAFGALFIEQFSENGGPADSDIQRLVPHIAQATFHAMDQEQIFLLPLRRFVGRWIEKSKLTKSRARIAVAGLALLMGLLILVKVPYRVQATGKLMPAQQFRAYAPFDCEAREILVRSGQTVEANQPLLRLYDETLQTRLLILTNTISEKRKLSAAYKAQLDENGATLSQSEKIGLSAKIAQNSIEIEGLQLQLASAQRLVESSNVRTEISGTVATFRPENLLAGRPVGRGELLIEVMNEQGSWNIELELPAKRFGHLLQATSEDPVKIPVTFIQATAPESTYEAVIGQISTRASQDNDGSSVILIHARIDEDQNIRRTIGAEVIAKIGCGKKSLGYVFFGDMLDWVRRRIW